MIWGDFLFRKLKRELDFLAKHIRMIFFSAFICCFGGMLLWVNGTNLWQVLRSGSQPSFSLSVTGLFLLWSFIYGLTGILLSLLFLQGKIRCCNDPLTSFAICSGIYLLHLVWYAVFFCTHLVLFACMILLVSFFLTIVLFLLNRHGFLLFRFLLILIFLVELYFIYFNLTFCLG
jgi:hypothetical protein